MSRELSRIEFFTADANVMRIQRMLMGVGILDFKAIPIKNAAVTKGGKLKAKSTGDRVQMFLEWCHQNKPTIINNKTAREFLASIDHPANTSMANYLLRRAVKQKFMRKTGKSSSTSYNLTTR